MLPRVKWNATVITMCRAGHISVPLFCGTRQEAGDFADQPSWSNNSIYQQAHENKSRRLRPKALVCNTAVWISTPQARMAALCESCHCSTCNCSMFRSIYILHISILSQQMLKKSRLQIPCQPVPSFSCKPAGRGVPQLTFLSQWSQALCFTKCHPAIERHLFQQGTRKIPISTLSNRQQHHLKQSTGPGKRWRKHFVGKVDLDDYWSYLCL